MSHTPGPWTFVPWHITEGNAEVRAGAPDDYALCYLPSDDDARLIAAAPDLLEALKGLLDDLDSVGRLNGFFDIKSAHAAIAKAEGRS